jgi:hypothetical protein
MPRAAKKFPNCLLKTLHFLTKDHPHPRNLRVDFPGAYIRSTEESSVRGRRKVDHKASLIQEAELSKVSLPDSNRRLASDLEICDDSRSYSDAFQALITFGLWPSLAAKTSRRTLTKRSATQMESGNGSVQATCPTNPGLGTDDLRQTRTEGGSTRKDGPDYSGNTASTASDRASSTSPRNTGAQDREDPRPRTTEASGTDENSANVHLQPERMLENTSSGFSDASYSTTGREVPKP